MSRGVLIWWRAVAAAGLLLFAVSPAAGVDRFPKPEFQSGYELPVEDQPPARAGWIQVLDVAVLAAALGAAAWLVLRKRSRSGVLLLTVFAVLYFGFWRRGCVCPVGATQNVAVALFDGGASIPWVVIVFFLLPLLAALLFGRVFCAAVCPLGAIQDLVALRPRPVPDWIAAVLGLFPYLFLGGAVYLAVMGAGYIVCRYDPFVALFRLSGPFALLVLGALMLGIGVFYARPYCRFVCPYAVLLGWLSRFARRHATITPDECINCRLCEEACPFGAIRKPTPQGPPEERARGVRRIALLLVLLPLLAGAGGWAVAAAHMPISRAHPAVRLLDRLQAENAGAVEGTTIESDAFRETGRTREELRREVANIQDRFRRGAWWLGGFLGLVVGGQLLGLSVHRTRDDYTIDNARCLSCARCFSYCPRHRLRYGGGPRREEKAAEA